jgi:hypothetical protein
LSLEEVGFRADQKVLMEVDDKGLLIVGNPQGIRRPAPLG